MQKASRTRASAFVLVIVAILAAFAYVAHAAISLSTTVPYTQSLDSLGTPPTATTTSTLPADFRVDATATSTAADVRKVGTFAAASLVTARGGGANLSTSAANGIYNFGAGTATLGNSDRAVGWVASGTATASGNLYAQLVNTTGAVLSGLKVSYNVEKYRNGSNAQGFRIQLFYSFDGATWTNAGAAFTTAFAPDSNNTGFATAPGATVPVSNQTLAVSIPDGSPFYLAWNYSVTAGNTVTNAQALAVDDISILGIGPVATNPSGVGAANPSSVAAGEPVTLTVAVTPGTLPTSTGLTVTADLSAIGGSVAQPFFNDGSNGDASSGDATHTFSTTVTVSTTPGVKSLPFEVRDSLNRTGNGSIALTVTAPPVITAIHDLQGPGSTSPYVGQSVTTEGIVTARRFNNGFFIQMPDSEADADASTSEGIFVFTGNNAIPASAQVGNRVRVTGLVAEFVADPGSLPATEITTPSTILLSTGNQLPAAVTLTSADTNPAGPLEQLERFEGMRVHVDALTVVAPTNGGFVSGSPTFAESEAVTRTDGVYYGVLPGIQRPFRQLGLELPNPLPPGSPCCVDRFDGNPERLRVDSNGNTAFGATDTTEVMSGATVSNITGVLDYSTHAYTIIPDFGAQGTVDGLHGYTPVSAPGPQRFTVATANLERFFDKVDDAGISDVAMSVTGYGRRLSKVALQICDVMRAPDIIGVEEVENIGVLNDIAAAANATASCGGTQYHAYLFEGNDPGGIDDGLLVNANRVVVNDVHQEGKDATFTDPTDGSTDLLNDRPPTVLHATITAAGSAPQDITVIANHLRSLNDIDADGPGGAGPRVRMKRLKQAEFLGKLIEDLQFANGADPVVAVGDFNAFEFSDGYVDVIGTIMGTPVAADRVVLASTDVPNTSAPLTDLITADATASRYSYSFDGNAQSLDHLLATSAAVQIFDHIEWGHSNADFPESFRADASRPERLSDHDPVVAYFVLAATTTTSVTAVPNPAPFGEDITFTATVGTPAPATSGVVQFSDGAGYSASVTVSSGQASVVVPASSFGVGAHTMNAAFSDGISFAASSGSIAFSVVDVEPPAISGVVNLVVEANGPAGTVVNFSPKATDDVDGTVAVVCTPPSGTTFPLGTTTVTCTAVDAAGNTSSVSFTVTVRDTTAPSMPVLSVTPGELSPPNHRMVDVTVAAQATDTVSTVACSITSIVSNEPDNGLGDGDTANDIGPVSGLSATVRAERSGLGNGRLYTLTVTCRDHAGNTSSSTIGVAVPKTR